MVCNLFEEYDTNCTNVLNVKYYAKEKEKNI